MTFQTHGETLAKKAKISKKDPAKYRGISIGSNVCKLVINIILERLRNWYEAQLTDHQNGFRKNRRTIKRVQQISHRERQPFFFCLFTYLPHLTT